MVLNKDVGVHFGVWKHDLDALCTCVDSLSVGPLMKFLDETAEAQLTELSALLKSMKDGEGPPSLQPYELNDFMFTVCTKLPWFFNFTVSDGELFFVCACETTYMQT